MRMISRLDLRESGHRTGVPVYVFPTGDTRSSNSHLISIKE